MPFGMGPAGWAYMSPYAYPYASSYPYSYSYAGASYPVWPWWGGRGRGRGRGFWPALVCTLLVHLVVEPRTKSV